MNKKDHLIQNTASLFDMKLVEVKSTYPYESAFDTAMVDPMLLSYLKERNMTPVQTISNALMDIIVIGTPCKCMQGLIKFKKESIVALERDHGFFDVDEGFLFDDVHVFFSDSGMRIFIDELDYIVPNKDVEQLYPFFKHLYSQELTEQFNKLSEDMGDQIERLNRELSRSNLANLPIELHKYLVRQSFDTVNETVGISSSGEFYLNAQDKDNIRLYFTVNDVSSNLSSIFKAPIEATEEEINNLLSYPYKEDVKRFTYSTERYVVVEDVYDDCIVYAVSLSLKSFEDSFDPSRTPIENLIEFIF